MGKLSACTCTKRVFAGDLIESVSPSRGFSRLFRPRVHFSELFNVDISSFPDGALDNLPSGVVQTEPGNAVLNLLSDVSMCGVLEAGTANSAERAQTLAPRLNTRLPR